VSLIENIKKRGLKDIFNLKKIKIFSRFLSRKALKRKYPELSIPHYKEQIVYRMRLCPDCLEAGKCINCSCISPELFYDRENYCSEDRWKEMKEKEEWEKEKIEKGITISKKHLKDLEKEGIIKHG